MKDETRPKDEIRSKDAAPDGANNTSSRTKPQSHKGKSKPKSRNGKKDPNGYTHTKGSNDFVWHTPDAALLERAAEVSWSYQTGELLDLAVPSYGGAGTYTSTPVSQAGIIVIRDQISCGGAGYYTPSYKETLYTLPTFNAANSLLTEMRSRSRIRNTYDAPDVFMLMMAMSSIYSGVILAKRLAATARMFTYKNQYLPEALIRVQGFDPDWFKVNQFRFVTELNIIISEINKIYIPNKMHLFELINERFSHYFTEGEDVRDQLYVITPAFLNYITYNPNANYASMVKPFICIPGTISGTAPYITNYSQNAVYSGDVLLNALRFMLNQVINHDSTPDITGDMENCFGTGERFYIPDCDPNAIALPVFDEEILETIHNMTWSKFVSDTFTNYSSANGQPIEPFSIIQDAVDNRIGMYDCFSVADSAVQQAMAATESACRILDVHRDPNPQKTFAITRFKNMVGQRTVASGTLYTNVMHGSDLICEVCFYRFKYNSGGNPTLYNTRLNMLNNFPSAAALADFFFLESFHYRPFVYYYDGTTGKLLEAWPIGESDIWAMSDWAMIKNMNRISLLSLLGAYNNI